MDKGKLIAQLERALSDAVNSTLSVTEQPADVSRALAMIVENLQQTGGMPDLNKALSLEALRAERSKHEEEASFTISVAPMGRMRAGLEGLLGLPAVEVNGSVLYAMAAEHCECADSEVSFSTGNGIAATTSKLEWEFVVDPVPGKEYPVREGLAAERRRVAMPLSAFSEELIEVNRTLVSSGLSLPLRKEELVGARMYTGPIYVKYSAVMRAFSPVPFLAEQAKKLCQGNKYVTSIFALK